jgi:hypothetical protein
MTNIVKLMILAWATVRGWLIRPYKTYVVTGCLPKKLKKRTLYIVEEDGFEEQAAMLCPCGCGRILHMNLLPDERPCWHVTHHRNGTASLHPSVWRKKDCGSHFWFRDGRVQWCVRDEEARS